MRVKSISIVTPCLNAESRICGTVKSIVRQTAVLSGRVGLQYIVCDGASSDGTVEIVRRLGGEHVQVVSKSDSNMYEALATGLQRVTGDVVAYLNAGDYYHPRAFDVVTDIFETGRVEWLTGMYYIANHRGELVRYLLPHRFRRGLMSAGIYGRLLPYVQQEATFWSRSLLETVDYETLASFRLAGDYFLWKSFAQRADLAIVDTFLGAFVRHGGQLSEARWEYLREMDLARRRARPWDYLLALADGALWLLASPALKKRLNRRLLFRWDDESRCWH